MQDNATKYMYNLCKCYTLNIFKFDRHNLKIQRQTRVFLNTGTTVKLIFL